MQQKARIGVGGRYVKIIFRDLLEQLVGERWERKELSVAAAVVAAAVPIAIVAPVTVVAAAVIAPVAVVTTTVVTPVAVVAAVIPAFASAAPTTPGTALALLRRLGFVDAQIPAHEFLVIERGLGLVGGFLPARRAARLKIVDALKKKGHIVAMTGDGINDAPALKKADIGVAMGISGTDVSKEASAMILTDDNFASIVNAVEEGRGIHDNIKKYFAFLISGNIGEVLIIFISIIMGIPLPLTVTQILLINLAMDGPPAISLSAEPSEPDVMSRKPRNQKEPIYSRIGNYVFLFPAVMVVAVLLVFIYFYRADGLVKAQTMAFLTIIMFRLFEVFACRSLTKNVFKMGLFKNRWLVAAVASSFAIVVLTLYVPLMNKIFDTMPISILEFLFIILLSSLGAIAIEISKFLGNRGKAAVNI